NGTTAASLGLDAINVAGSTGVGTDVVDLVGDLALSLLNQGTGVRFDNALDDLNISFRDGTQAKVDFHKLPVAGTKPTGTTHAANTNAALTFTAKTAGAQYAGVHVSFVNDNSVVAGSNESVVYDSNAKTLTFHIKDGQTTANSIIDALNRNPDVSKLFSVSNAS